MNTLLSEGLTLGFVSRIGTPAGISLVLTQFLAYSIPEEPDGGYRDLSKSHISHIRFHSPSSLIKLLQALLTLLARASVRGSSTKLKMCKLNSTGRSRRKSRFKSGAIVVDTKSSSAGVQSPSSAARYCCLTVVPADLSAENSSLDRCAGSLVCPKTPDNGLGDGAGVGGLAMGTYKVPASVAIMEFDTDWEVDSVIDIVANDP